MIQYDGNTQSIKTLLQAFARDAVSIQTGLDNAYMDDMHRFTAIADALHQVFGETAHEQMPSRLQLSEHRIDARFRFAKEKRLGGALSVRLMNNAYDLLFARSTQSRSSDSRIAVTITQVPSRD